MFGFVVAGVSAAGLLFLSRGHRYGHRYGHRGMRFLFSRLDASPAQEKVIRNAMDEARGSAKRLRDQLKASRGELADLVRGEWNEDQVQAWVAGRAAQFNEAAPELVQAFAKVHEVLDDRQRSTLAHFLEKGRPFPMGLRGHHHHHHHHHCGHAAC